MHIASNGLARFTRFGLAALPLAVAGVVTAAPFTPGDLVVTRVVGGTGSYDPNTKEMTSTAVLSGGGTPNTVVLDEYTTSGVLVQTIQMPNVQATSGNRALTLASSANTEGHITLSGDKRYLVVAGYNVNPAVGPGVGGAPGTSGPNMTTSVTGSANTYERVFGRIDINGNIDTTTVNQDIGLAKNPRSAYSSDGSGFWLSGQNATAPSNSVHYLPYQTTTSTQVTTTPNNTNERVLNAFNGQLYLSSNNNIYQVGTGLPTTAGQTATDITGTLTFTRADTGALVNAAVDDFILAPDLLTLYIADSTQNSTAFQGGVRKYTRTDTSSTTWTLQYSATLGASTGTPNANVNLPGAHGLAGYFDTSLNQWVLFATTVDGQGVNTDKLFKVIDTGSAFTTTELATSFTNSAFRGVEFIPVPEPMSLAGCALVGLMLVRRRK